MSERDITTGGVSDKVITETLESILRQPNAIAKFTYLTDVVQHLQSKLGLDLDHKRDFIRNHVQLLIQSHPPPPPNDHFAPRQNLSFRPGIPPGVGVAPPLKEELNIAAAQVPKQSAQTGKKRRGGPGGLNKLCGVTPELQTIVGQPELARTEIVKQLWAYIRKNNLQDPSNKRRIICNDELRLVFETDCTDMFKMNKLLAKHIITLEPTKAVGQSSKKPKVDAGSGEELAESDPIVLISESLANLFGTNGREMPQSEASRRVWQYARINQLEDPMNPMSILCDTKLQELLGCATISAMAVPEMLARLHLFKR